MTLRSIVETAQPVNVKVVTYAKNGNTVVIHHEKVHPVIPNAGIFKTKPDAYGQYTYVLVVHYACGYGIRIDGLSRHDEDAEYLQYHASFDTGGELLPLKEVIRRICQPYATEEAYLQHLDTMAQTGKYLRAANIRLAEEILRSAPDRGQERLRTYRDARQRYRDTLEQEEQRRKEERRLQKEQEQAAAVAQQKQQMKAMEEKLLQDGRDIPVDVDAIFLLASAYGVTIPINVKGWMRRSLCNITIKDGRITAWRYYNSPSRTAPQYLMQLIAALRHAHELENAQCKEEPYEPIL